MKRIAWIVATIAIGAGGLGAQEVTLKEDAPGLLKKAKVSPEAARATAMARVPGGKLKTAEIEMEDGKLVYVYTLAIAGKTGVEEVLVNAMTGAVVSVEHESPEDEAAEAKAEKAKAKKPSATKAGTKPPAIR